MNVITTEQSRHFSHIVRKNQLKAVALTGKINGTRRRGLQKGTTGHCTLVVKNGQVSLMILWGSIDVVRTTGVPADRQRQCLTEHTCRTD